MDYVQRNMCDNPQTYKFENFKTEPNNLSIDAHKGSSSQNNKMKRSLRSTSNRKVMISEADVSGNNEEQDSIDSTKQKEKDQPKDNKRVLKMNRKNLQKLDDFERFDEAENQIKKNKHSARTVNNSKEAKNDSCQNSSSYNVSSEEQKNSMHLSGGSKMQVNSSNIDSSSSTKMSTNYICLNNGRIVIKGNEIETTVPWDIETINNKVSMISPHYPVRVVIYPLSLNEPHVYDPKSQSFTSKDNYSGNNIGECQPASSFDTYLRHLEKHYWLDNCVGSQNPVSSTQSGAQYSRMMRKSGSDSQTASMLYP